MVERPGPPGRWVCCTFVFMDAALPAPVAGAPVTLYHRRYAKQQRAKALGHLGAAFVLLAGVLPVLAGTEPLTPLRALEVAVGASYLGLLARELRHHAFHHGRVAWLELAAAGILALEGCHSWHRPHAANLARGTHAFHALPCVFWAAALVYVGLAFAAQQLGRRRYLRLRPDGFGLRTRLLGRARQGRWADLAALEAEGPAAALLRFAAGRRQRVSFAHLHAGFAHRDQLVAYGQQQLAVSNEP